MPCARPSCGHRGRDQPRNLKKVAQQKQRLSKREIIQARPSGECTNLHRDQNLESHIHHRETVSPSCSLQSQHFRSGSSIAELLSSTITVDAGHKRNANKSYYKSGSDIARPAGAFTFLTASDTPSLLRTTGCFNSTCSSFVDPFKKVSRDVVRRAT